MRERRSKGALLTDSVDEESGLPADAIAMPPPPSISIENATIRQEHAINIGESAPLSLGTNGAGSQPTPRRHATLWARLVLLAEPVFDAVTAAVLIVVALLVDRIDVRNAFILKETLYLHSYPVKDNTVPSWTVPLYAVLGPALVFLIHTVVARKSWWRCWRLCMALLIAVFLTAAVTSAFKVSLARPRPNFVLQCWGATDGVPVWANGTETEAGGFAVCSCDSSTNQEIRKSWPSGHSSISASGLGFLSFWLLGLTRAYTGNGYAWRVVVSILPSMGAIAVGITRITDYWHYWSDVLTGLCMGFGIAFVVYRQLFPLFTHPSCDTPMYELDQNKEH